MVCARIKPRGDFFVVVENSTKPSATAREVPQIGLKDLPPDGWGKTPHWVVHGGLAAIVRTYGRGAGLVWWVLAHTIEGHHVSRARVSIRELARATGLSRTGVERGMRRLRAGGEVVVVERQPGLTFVYEMRQRVLAGGQEVSR